MGRGRPRKNANANTMTENPPAEQSDVANFHQVIGPETPIPEVKIPQSNMEGTTQEMIKKAMNELVSCEVAPREALRNHKGLLNNVEYAYSPDGTIDWKAMLFKKPEYLYILADKKAEVEAKYGKPVYKLDPLEVDEKYLCITLPGIRYLANLRGFKKIKNKVNHVNYDANYETVTSCTVTTTITWIPNFETDYREVKSSDVAGANLRNCFGFTQKYIESMAANRGFVRAVRNFLNIGIVAKDEVGPQEKNPDSNDKLLPIHNPNSTATSPVENTSSPDLHSILEDKVHKLGIDFQKFKTAIIKKYKGDISSEPEQWESYQDIPTADIFKLLGIVQTKLDEKNSVKP